MPNIIVLKAEKIAGYLIRLDMLRKSEYEEYVFRVYVAEDKVEAIGSFQICDDIGVAMRVYRKEKDKVNDKMFNLTECLMHCRSKEMTPHQTAEYLFQQGYQRRSSC